MCNSIIFIDEMLKDYTDVATRQIKTQKKSIIYNPFKCSIDDISNTREALQKPSSLPSP